MNRPNRTNQKMRLQVAYEGQEISYPETKVQMQCI